MISIAANAIPQICADASVRKRMKDQNHTKENILKAVSRFQRNEIVVTATR